MGVRHLETFMKNTVPGGYVDVDIADECNKFKSDNNGQRPILVIDLMGLVNSFARDGEDRLYGCRFNIMKTQIDNLLRLLHVHSDLYFFEDGPSLKHKCDTWIKRHNEKYFKCIDIMERIYDHTPIQEITKSIPLSMIPANTASLNIIGPIAKKYGTLTVTMTKECDAELAKFASANENVLAVLGDDTDFLIFPGKWRYFSLNALNEKNLMSKEFNRQALRNFLQITDDQLVIFSTLAGNDVIQYEEVRPFHNFCGHRAEIKFPELAHFIKTMLNTNRIEMVKIIARRVLRNQSPETYKRIETSLNLYDTNFDVVDYSQSAPLLHYCIQKGYTFSFSVLKGFPKYLTHLYYDMRNTDFPECSKVAVSLHKRLIGVLLQHKATEIGNKGCEIFTKRSHEESYKQFLVNPVYPEVLVPPLDLLLNRDEHPEIDDVRYHLLTWLMGDRNLWKYDLRKIPKNYLQDVLTLDFMTSNGFIKIVEADLILLTIKHVELDMLPEAIEYPPVVDERAFRIAILFSRLYMKVGKTLEVVGLKDSFRKSINFDGVLFHVNYLKCMKSLIDPTILVKDLEDYRIYK